MWPLSGALLPPSCTHAPSLNDTTQLEAKSSFIGSYNDTQVKGNNSLGRLGWSTDNAAKTRGTLISGGLSDISGEWVLGRSPDGKGQSWNVSNPMEAPSELLGE